MAKNENETEYTCTRITPHMVVIGGIESSDNVLIEGQVFGNIDTSADLTADNLIVGNVKATNIALNAARIKGNVDMQGTLSVGENTIVVGDIRAENIKVSGKVRGEIDVKENALLTESALVVGNIVADYVTTQAGARIKGAITTRNKANELDIDSEFDFGDMGGEF